MDELTPRARALLREARPAFSPEAPQLARLRARLDMPGPPTDDGGPARDDGTVAATSTGTANVGLYIVVIALAVLVAWSAVPPRHPATLTPALDRAAAIIAGIPIPPPQATTDETMPIEPAPALPIVAAAAQPVTEAAPAEPRARRSRRSTTPVVGDPAPPSTDALAAELALIGDARRAANSGAWPTVRSLVATHQRSFPSGVLREEARVLDLLARCATAPSAELTATVRAYLETPGRLFAARLRRACLADDDDAQ